MLRGIYLMNSKCFCHIWEFKWWHFSTLCCSKHFIYIQRFLFQFDEQADIEFRMPSRYSQSYDYDSTLDSPTVRSSSSTQPVDDEVVVADHTSEVRANKFRLRLDIKRTVNAKWRGLRHGDLTDFWPKTILEISGSQLNPLRTFFFEHLKGDITLIRKQETNRGH